MKRAIVKHLRDVVAILALFVVGAGVSGYILTKQRLTLPGWVPVIGTEFYELEAAFSTAQAVTPGQGQTVTVAGVSIGELSEVRLSEGQAIVRMRIKDRYRGRVYRDASGLLRPKTGLKDIVVELDPGTKAAGSMPEGARVPVSETLPDVNFDEILASLDADTRDYLRLLLGGGAEGLRDNGAGLRRALKRFEPTGRALRAVNQQLATRRANIRRAIRNFSLLAGELGAKDDEIARFVDSSNAVFASFASQDESLRATLRELPGALEATDEALGRVDGLADELGPTLSALRPTARALGPSLRAMRPFLRTTTPIIRDQIRPFSTETQPFVRELRPTMGDLADATPDLSSSFRVLNRLFNTLTYNPPGAQEEGFLFWASWLNHTFNSAFSNEDAHGPVRRGVVILGCGASQLLDNVVQVNRRLGALIGLLNSPTTAQICAAGTTAGQRRRSADVADQVGGARP